ncbi:hypothetical protein ACH5RR_037511 [Cinchona calisaya]|uniref:Uncharacterized protein n=1 Tax=Cinchona calisaya TaxID=153742 RepID=A0ABD2Y9H2_9GENT
MGAFMRRDIYGFGALHFVGWSVLFHILSLCAGFHIQEGLGWGGLGCLSLRFRREVAAFCCTKTLQFSCGFSFLFLTLIDDYKAGRVRLFAVHVSSLCLLDE